jgi:hypothetical protein
MSFDTYPTESIALFFFLVECHTAPGLVVVAKSVCSIQMKKKNHEGKARMTFVGETRDESGGSAEGLGERKGERGRRRRCGLVIPFEWSFSLCSSSVSASWCVVFEGLASFELGLVS